MFKNRSITRCVLWVVAEIILNLIGLDDLADYSEFVLEKKVNKKVNIPEVLVVDKSIHNELEYCPFSVQSSPSFPI